MATAVFYKSILGSTKQYADSLSKIVHAKIFEYNEFKPELVSDFDQIVVLSGTYLGKMPLTDFLKEHWDYIEDKRVIAVAVGLFDKNSGASQKSYGKIPAKIRNKIRYIKIKGALLPKLTETQIVENLKKVVEIINE